MNIKKFFVGSAAGALMLASSVFPAFAAPAFRITVAPFSFNALGLADFDPSLNGPAAHGQWMKVDGDWILSLAKNVPTAEVASAGAQVNGVKGVTLSELGFDYRNDGWCGAGAPRFNVSTTVGTYFFFGCTYGTHTVVDADWTRVRFGNGDAFPADGVTPWPGFGTAVVTGISVVFDEGTDVGSGKAYLDNIDVNGVLAGGPGSTN